MPVAFGAIPMPPPRCGSMTLAIPQLTLSLALQDRQKKVMDKLQTQMDKVASPGLPSLIFSLRALESKVRPRPHAAARGEGAGEGERARDTGRPRPRSRKV